MAPGKASTSCGKFLICHQFPLTSLAAWLNFDSRKTYNTQTYRLGLWPAKARSIRRAEKVKQEGTLDGYRCQSRTATDPAHSTARGFESLPHRANPV